MNWRIVFGTLAVGFGFQAERFVVANDLFERPVRLKADGKVIDTGANWGHSGPCVEDIDGDGLKDLLVGDFSGKFRIYKNVGTAGRPEYQDAGLLKAGEEDAHVRIYCCIGSQPRFADFDGDGVRDMISNSYDPGHCYLFRGLPDRRFAAMQELKDQDGVPIRSAPRQKQNYQSFGSFFTPVDWDGDGDQDLLIGCFDGELKLRINEGDAREARFAAENIDILAGDEPLKVERHCCPVVADWDGDGLWDILSGSEEGSVAWFRNIGTKDAPKFEAGVVLVEKAQHSGYDQLRLTDAEIVPGIRTQIEVVDHNGDGKLDLLVGDFCSVFEAKPGLTEAKKKQLSKLVARRVEIGKPITDKLDALRKDFARRYPGDALFSDEAEAEWSKAYKELHNSPEFQTMEKEERELARQIKPFLSVTRPDAERLFDLSKAHGYVWLFVRK